MIPSTKIILLFDLDFLNCNVVKNKNMQNYDLLIKEFNNLY